MVLLSEIQNMTRAADALGRSQPAITKSITALEGELQVRLFERTHTGVRPTAQCSILCRRVRMAMEHLERARAAHVEGGGNAAKGRNFFSLDVNNRRLMAFLTLFDCRNLRKAAHAAGHDLSTIRKSIKTLEAELGCVLFERAPYGLVVPTSSATLVAKHAKLAIWEIRTGIDEVASMVGAIQGSIVVGVICHARTAWVPRAVNQLLLQHPRIRVSICDGDYDPMEVALSFGELDFIVGSLRGEPTSTDLIAEPLMSNEIQVIARKGHPLNGCKRLSLRDVSDYEWVLPPRPVPMRQRLFDLLREQSLPPPKSQIESSSATAIRGLLLESDRVAVSSGLSFQHDIDHGMLCVLPVSFSGSGFLKRVPMTLHLTMRARAAYPSIAHAFIWHLRSVAQQMEHSYTGGNRSSPRSTENGRGVQSLIPN